MYSATVIKTEQDEHGIFSTLLFNGMLSLSLLNGDRITVFADDDDGDVMKLVQVSDMIR